jgi:hypothetical protein
MTEARVELKNGSIPYPFQQVNQQVDNPCDGILGRDFLQQMKAKICYENRTIELNGEPYKMVGNGKESDTDEVKAKPTNFIKLPPRSESVVKLPVSPGSPPVGVIDKYEIQDGIIMAASLTRSKGGYVMTSIINTRDNEVEIREPIVHID